jgi:hypothetical protein
VDSAYVRYLTQERFFGAAVFPGTGIEAVGDAHDGRVPEYSGSGRAAYLIWLGVKLLWSSRHGRSLSQSGAGGRSSPLSAVRDGLINNLTNPKPLLFMFAFLPQFVSPDRGSVTTQLLVLGLTQKATGLVVHGSVALASGAVGGWLACKPGFLVWQERFAGFVMVGLGLRLLLAGDGRPARADHRPRTRNNEINRPLGGTADAFNLF